VAEEGREAGLAFLQAEIYGREVKLPMRRITAWERYSNQV
jgi:hypothetical protein